MTVREGELPKQPLFYVLASIRFQPWLKLPELIPEIQGRLRERFPLFTPVNYAAAGLQLTQQVGDGVSGESGSRPNAWFFHRNDRRVGCQLATEQIIVHALEYSRFVRFSEHLEFVLKAFVDFAGFIDVSSLGIRYLDRIEPMENERLQDYLPTELLPLDTRNKSYPVIGGVCQNSYKTTDGILQARFWTGQGMLNVPADLIQLYAMTADPSSIASHVKAIPVNHGILDTDSIWISQPPQRLDTEGILKRIDSLHRHANWFFREICSEQAFKAWQGGE